MAELVEKWTNDLARHLKQRRGVKVTVRPEVHEFLIGKAEGGPEGAGTLRRLFTREVENRLAHAMLEEQYHEGDWVEVQTEKGELVVRQKKRTPTRREAKKG
jgi:ATP-dependent Clp protease ATP-binding subunit ClpA